MAPSSRHGAWLRRPFSCAKGLERLHRYDWQRVSLALISVRGACPGAGRCDRVIFMDRDDILNLYVVTNLPMPVAAWVLAEAREYPMSRRSSVRDTPLKSANSHR